MSNSKQQLWRGASDSSPSLLFFTAPSTPLHLSSSQFLDQDFEFRSPTSISQQDDDPPPSPKLISSSSLSFNNILPNSIPIHHHNPTLHRLSLDIASISAATTPPLSRSPSFSNYDYESPPSKPPTRSCSGKRWAFKDLLRRTVPSSKYETREEQQQQQQQQQQHPVSLLRQVKSESASPRTPRQQQQQQQAMAKSAQKPKVSQISKSLRYPQSPQRSPMAVHYSQQRAADLKHRTFLPYRHSLLGGCLGRAFTSKPDSGALVW